MSNDLARNLSPFPPRPPCPPRATRFPFLGHGIGLRTCHYPDFLGEGPQEPTTGTARPDGRPRIDWLEVITDNFLVDGGNPRRVLRDVREQYPVVFHGVALSIGSTDPLDAGYLDAIARLADETEPAWISDHLCFGNLGGRYGHDLWPLPFSEEALAHVSERVLRVQDRLRRPLMLENVSSYVAFRASTMTEWEFLSALVEKTDCGLLLDVNNIFVSAHNHGFAAEDFLAGVPVDAVGQIHLAGHSRKGPLLLDTHDHPVPDGVWSLYEKAIARFGAVSTLVEWDEKVPTVGELIAESRRAESLLRATLRQPLASSAAVSHVAL